MRFNHLIGNESSKRKSITNENISIPKSYQC